MSEEKMDTIEEKLKESMSGDAQIKEHFGQFGEIERVTLKTDMATGRSRGSFAKRAANAFLLGLASLLPTPASGSDPITNLIR